MLAGRDLTSRDSGGPLASAGGEARGLPDERGAPTGTNAPTSLWPTMRKGPLVGGRNERVEATGLSGVGVATIMLVLLVAGFVLFLFRHRW
jgi:hypothetical protein